MELAAELLELQPKAERPGLQEKLKINTASTHLFETLDVKTSRYNGASLEIVHNNMPVLCWSVG